MREGNSWAQTGEGALNHWWHPGWSPEVSKSQDYYLQANFFFPWSAPSWVLPTLTLYLLRTNSNGGFGPRPSPLTLLLTGEDGFSGPPATCHLGLLSPAGSQGPTHLAQPTSFPLLHASRPCRSLRSRARSCLKKPLLGMMPRWSLTFLMASTRVRWWYSMR